MSDPAVLVLSVCSQLLRRRRRSLAEVKGGIENRGTKQRWRDGWQLDLRYFRGQSASVYSVSYGDLEDERWTLREWHADRWLRALQCNFAAKDISVARPDLWASDDPSARVGSEQETGNANLLSFVLDGCIENGEPRRHEDVKRLNDGLRQRGRSALRAVRLARQKLR